jgi:hypothetical protein
MRRRVAQLVRDIEDLNDVLAPAIPRELGIDVPFGIVGPHWPEFFAQCTLKDVLDAVTVAFRQIVQKKQRGVRDINAENRWIREVRRIFAEENLHYTVDDFGGVHFRFDGEFDGNRAAAIAALQGGRYANALHSLEGGMAALGEAPANGKIAVRGVFAAAECVFKLILAKAPRLAADQVDGLAPILDRIFGNDETARRSTSKMLASLKDWVDAAHFYRHEQGVADKVAQPPLTLAVYLVSVGASHLRWLAELDGFSKQGSRHSGPLVGQLRGASEPPR